MTGCTLSLHHPFQFDVLQEQIKTGDFSYFAAPEQIINWLLNNNELPPPKKLAIVRRDSHLPLKNARQSPSTDLYDLWNLGGLGSVPTKYINNQPTGLFPQGRICLPSTTEETLCLAGAKICHDRLHIKGRIFPDTASMKTSLEWLSLKKRFDGDWLDTGLAAFPGPDNSIFLGKETPVDLQKVAS
jgi:hypothetical protein